MTTEAQTAAQLSLTILEASFRRFDPAEQREIELLRNLLRELIGKYHSSAELAMIAVGFEIAIKEKQ